MNEKCPQICHFGESRRATAFDRKTVGGRELVAVFSTFYTKSKREFLGVAELYLLQILVNQQK